jgi:hypothetical protein
MTHLLVTVGFIMHMLGSMPNASGFIFKIEFGSGSYEAFGLIFPQTYCELHFTLPYGHIL